MLLNRRNRIQSSVNSENSTRCKFTFSDRKHLRGVSVQVLFIKFKHRFDLSARFRQMYSWRKQEGWLCIRIGIWAKIMFVTRENIIMSLMTVFLVRWSWRLWRFAGSSRQLFTNYTNQTFNALLGRPLNLKLMSTFSPVLN